MGYYTLNHTGPISLNLAVQPDKLERPSRRLQAEIRRSSPRTTISPTSSLRPPRPSWPSTTSTSARRPASYAHTVSFWWAVAGLDYYTGYLDNLSKVSRADIKKYIETYVYKKPYVLGIFISEEDQKAIGLDLKKAESWAPLKP
jgi:zinc protease